MKRFLNQILFWAVVMLLACSSAFAQSFDISGKWKTLDDEEKEANGQPKAKSVVEIWRADKDETIDGVKFKKGSFYGRIIQLMDPKKQNSLCNECASTDPRYKKKVVGMVIVTGLLKTENNKWEADNSILDPNNGKIYDCSMWIENGNLQVRGYIGFFYRTQTWLKF